MDDITDCILRLCADRGEGKSLCPSEVARALDPDHWRLLMPAVREAAALLAREGRLRITQSGREISPDRLRGPIRLSRPLQSPARTSTPGSE